MKKRKLEVIPTIWVQSESIFSELIRNYYMNGIKKLRINCTRHSPQRYIMDINYLRDICLEVADGCMEIMIDIPYPRKKIRIDEHKGAKNISKGDVIYLTSDIEMYEREDNIIYTKVDLEQYLDLGVRVVIGDSEPEFEVRCVGKKSELYCLKSGKIKYKKSITTDKLKFVSDLDYEEINQFKEMVKSVKPDIIALSCIESAYEVLKAKEDLGLHPSTKIMVKIENDIGSKNIVEIGKVADSVMIARGDLLINCGERGFIDAIERVIVGCEKDQIPYYMATGILDGIVDGQPTRSELAELFYLRHSKCKGAIMEYDKCNTSKKFLEMIKFF